MSGFFADIDYSILKLPTIDNGLDSGKHNRRRCTEFLENEMKDMKRLSKTLKVNINDLAPYFAAYGVASLPQHCGFLLCRFISLESFIFAII